MANDQLLFLALLITFLYFVIIVTLSKVAMYTAWPPSILKETAAFISKIPTHRSSNSSPSLMYFGRVFFFFLKVFHQRTTADHRSNRFGHLHSQFGG